MADIKAFKSGPQAKFIAENPGCDKKPEESSSEEEDSSDEDSSEEDSSDDDEPRKRKKLTPEQIFIKANKPKPSPSAYILFCAEHREEAKKEAPNSNGAALMKLLGTKWKAASKDVRAAFLKKAKDLREQYNVDMKAFNDGPLAEWREKNGMATKKRKVNDKGEGDLML